MVPRIHAHTGAETNEAVVARTSIPVLGGLDRFGKTAPDHAEWQHGGAHARSMWAWQVRLGTEDQTTTGHEDKGNGTDEKVKEELEARHKGA